MRRRYQRRLPIAVLVVVVLIAARYFTRPSDNGPFIYDESQTHVVERVVDGDTLLLAGGIRVRLLGVDTPETKHPDLPVEPLGPEASAFTTRHVEGRRVTLKFDRERRDRYHRVLAYVYRGDWMLNEELIRAGLSRAETQYSFSSVMKRRFLQAEEEARQYRRGLWAQQAAD